MANFCNFEIRVKGARGNAMLVYASMPAVDDCPITYSRGTNAQYEIHFRGCTKWSVNYDVTDDWDGSDLDVDLNTLSNDDINAIGNSYWDYSLKAKSRVLQCEILALYWSDESNFNQFDHYVNGVCIKQRKISYFPNAATFNWDVLEFEGHEGEYDDTIEGDALGERVMGDIIADFQRLLNQPNLINATKARTYSWSDNFTGEELFDWKFNQRNRYEGDGWSVAIPDGFCLWEGPNADTNDMIHFVPEAYRYIETIDGCILPAHIFINRKFAKAKLITDDMSVSHPLARLGYAESFAQIRATLQTQLNAELGENDTCYDIRSFVSKNFSTVLLVTYYDDDALLIEGNIISNALMHPLGFFSEEVPAVYEQMLFASINNWLHTYQNPGHEYISTPILPDEKLCINQLLANDTTELDKAIKQINMEISMAGVGRIECLKYRFSNGMLLPHEVKELTQTILDDGNQVRVYYVKRLDALLDRLKAEELSLDTMATVYAKLLELFDANEQQELYDDDFIANAITSNGHSNNVVNSTELVLERILKKWQEESAAFVQTSNTSVFSNQEATEEPPSEASMPNEQVTSSDAAIPVSFEDSPDQDPFERCTARLTYPAINTLDGLTFVFLHDDDNRQKVMGFLRSHNAILADGFIEADYVILHHDEYENRQHLMEQALELQNRGFKFQFVSDEHLNRQLSKLDKNWADPIQAETYAAQMTYSPEEVYYFVIPQFLEHFSIFWSIEHNTYWGTGPLCDQTNEHRQSVWSRVWIAKQLPNVQVQLTKALLNLSFEDRYEVLLFLYQIYENEKTVNIATRWKNIVKFSDSWFTAQEKKVILNRIDCMKQKRREAAAVSLESVQMSTCDIDTLKTKVFVICQHRQKNLPSGNLSISDNENTFSVFIETHDGTTAVPMTLDHVEYYHTDCLEMWECAFARGVVDARMHAPAALPFPKKLLSSILWQLDESIEDRLGTAATQYPIRYQPNTGIMSAPICAADEALLYVIMRLTWLHRRQLEQALPILRSAFPEYDDVQLNTLIQVCNVTKDYPEKEESYTAEARCFSVDHWKERILPTCCALDTNHSNVPFRYFWLYKYSCEFFKDLTHDVPKALMKDWLQHKRTETHDVLACQYTQWADWEQAKYLLTIEDRNFQEDRSGKVSGIIALTYEYGILDITDRYNLFVCLHSPDGQRKIDVTPLMVACWGVNTDFIWARAALNGIYDARSDEMVPHKEQKRIISNMARVGIGNSGSLLESPEHQWASWYSNVFEDVNQWWADILKEDAPSAAASLQPRFTIENGVLKHADIPEGYNTIIIPEGVVELGSNCLLPANTTMEDLEDSQQEIYRSITQIHLPRSLKRISDNALSDLETQVRTLSLPESLEEIGLRGCAGFDHLTSISIPPSVKRIKTAAFAACGSLENVTIPNPAAKIYCGAFKDLPDNATLNVPQELAFIAHSYYITETQIIKSNCLSSVATEPEFHIQNGVLKGVYLPENCHTVILPDTIVKIEEDAFYGAQMESVILPNSLKSIEKHAFSHCQQLNSITIPASVTTIEDSAFDSTALKSITILASNESIEIKSYAFSESRGLESVTIQNPSAIVHYNAFGFFQEQLEHHRLTLQVPLKLAYLANYYPYAGIHYLDSVDNSTLANEPDFIVRDGVLIGANIPKTCTHITVPNGISSIESRALAHTPIETIDLPTTLRSIRAEAFMGCWNLKKVTIPEGVAFTNLSAFSNCEKLEYIQFPSTFKPLFQAISGSNNLNTIVCPNDKVVRLWKQMADQKNITWYAPSSTKALAEETLGVGAKVCYLSDEECDKLRAGIPLEKVIQPEQQECAQVDNNSRPKADPEEAPRNVEDQLKQNRRNQLTAEKTELLQELNSAKGLFAAFKRKKLQERIDELDRQLRFL